MKKTFIFLNLFLFSLFTIYSQTMQLIDIEYMSEIDCKRSFKIRIVNNDWDIVTGISVKLFRLESPNIRLDYGDYRAYYAGLDSSGRKIFETSVIDISNKDSNYYEVEAFATTTIIQGIFPIVIPAWSKKFQRIYACNLANFRRHLLMIRGDSLEQANELKCDGAVGPIWDTNIAIDFKLIKGGLYWLDAGPSGSGYYEVVRAYDFGANSADMIFKDRDNIMGPYSYIGNCSGTESGDEDDIDTSDYDLQLLESDVFVSSICCSSQLNLLNPNFAGGTFPINKHEMSLEGSAINTRFIIRNTGNTASAPTKISFYLSEGYNSLFGVRANDKTIDLPSLAPGEGFLTNPSFVISDFRRSPGKYYLVIDVEPVNNDSDLENNFVSIPVEVKSEFGNSIGIIKPILLDPHNKSNLSEKPYTMSVYSIDGVLLSNQVINNESEERRIVSELPEGLFIIKNNERTYKIGK